MKRNLDLIRQILLTCEEITPQTVYMDDLMETDDEFDKISYHIQLLEDCGYIDAEKTYAMGELMPDFIIYRLTSSGHDYLDSVRDEKIYASIKQTLGKIALSAPLEVIKALGLEIMKQQIGL